MLVAMSGGVDSSVAAALLAGKGHDVIGVTMKNFCYSHSEAASGPASCCSLEAIEDARRVADRVGFPHYVLDFAEPFGRAVIDDFVREYAAGRTPNPCVRCNRLVRFPHLFARARALGADLLATGHYARVDRAGAAGAGPGAAGPVDARAGGPRLLRGADRAKDQSYYLWGLTPRLLESVAFPIGGLTKEVVRGIAAELGLEVAEKPESMEVCFVPGGDLRGFLEREKENHCLPEEALARFEPGPILSTAGERLGEHGGSAWLTVGQRRGLGVAAGEPRYVVELRPDNAVVLGTREELLAGGCLLEQVSWIRGAPPDLPAFDAEVQVRHRQQPVGARVTPAAGFTAAPAAASSRPHGGRPAGNFGSPPESGAITRVDFERPLAAVAPGQSAVLYRGDEVLGGGIIRESLP